MCRCPSAIFTKKEEEESTVHGLTLRAKNSGGQVTKGTRARTCLSGRRLPLAFEGLEIVSADER